VRAAIQKSLAIVLPATVAAALLMGLSTAAPAAALASGCDATVQDSPTPVHAWAAQRAPVAKWKYRGQVVTGSCYQLWAGGTLWDEVYCTCVGGGQGWIADQHLFCYRKFNCV
jgi:hypothetical protein